MQNARPCTESLVTMQEQILNIVGEVLGLDRSKVKLDDTTGLLGHLPEFDSMAVVSILTAIEDHFGITIADDEVDASIFDTVGSLTAFVASKVAAAA